MDAEAWDRRYAESDLVWSAGPNRFLAHELADLPPGRAVDVAAGEGRNAIWLAERGWCVTAVDFSGVGLAKARDIVSRHPRAAELRIGWVHADVLRYDFGADAFDLVVIAYLQLPAAERRTVVRRSFRSLHAGGTFFLVAHDSSNLADGVGGPQDAAVLFTAEDVLADLDAERFEVDLAHRVPRETDAGTAYDALVRLTKSR